MTASRLLYVVMGLVLLISTWSAEVYRQPLAESHQDAVASIIGLVIGVLGFTIAFIQLWNVKRSAEIARAAVQGLIVRIGLMEEVAIVDNILKATAEIGRMHVAATVNKDFSTHVYLTERYKSLRADLFEMRARLQERLTKDQRIVIQEAITKLASAESSVTRGLKNSRYPRLQALDGVLSDLTEEIVTISVTLKKEAVSDNVA